MKTRFLIIVGVACAGIIIGVLLHQQSQEFQYPRPGIYPNSEGKDILGQDTSDDPFMPDRFGKINLSRINLPPTEHNQTDYTKIGHLVSENQFKKILDEKNVQYDPDDFILIDGLTLDSYPPISGYCGYVQDMDKEDYWFSSTFRHDTLTDFEMFDQNPEPCKPGWMSCFCSLQTSLAEKNPKLSYFDESKEAQVGKIFQDYLNEGNKIVNVPDSFVIGKYNLEIAPEITPFCGQFMGGSNEWYFHGNINGTRVADFFLDLDKKPNLCAINEDSKQYNFQATPQGR